MLAVCTLLPGGRSTNVHAAAKWERLHVGSVTRLTLYDPQRDSAKDNNMARGVCQRKGVSIHACR